MSLNPSVAMNAGLADAPVAGVIVEITLPVKSQVTLTEEVCMAGGLPALPVLQEVFRSTLPVGYPVVGSKPVA
jgi:hypothetical protein